MRPPRLATILLCLLGAAGPSASQPADLEDAIDAAVAPYVEAGDFMGVVAVGRDGEPPLVRAYGSASVELGVPHTSGGVFKIGSVSKQVTAAAILLLQEDGSLSTSDPVRRHLPTFAHGEATIEQLLTHTAGIQDVYSLPQFGATAGRSGSFADVIADLGEAPLQFDPGAGYAYSNGGYAVLAAVIEAASGLPYGEFLERRVFGPLGMAHAAHDAPGAAVAGRVPGYEPWGARAVAPSVPVAPAFTTGSGSLWASAADLLAWAEALHTGRLLRPASYAALTQDYGRGYGYGVSVFERFGRRAVGHDGRVAGYASDLARYLDDDLTVVVLSNVESVARDPIRRAVAAAALGEPVDPAGRPPIRAPEAADLRDLAGAYAFGPGFVVTVRVEDGRLLARANEGGSSELIPTADGAWFSRMLYATVRFGRDEAGHVDRLIWGSGDGAPVGRRVG